MTREEEDEVERRKKDKIQVRQGKATQRAVLGCSSVTTGYTVTAWGLGFGDATTVVAHSFIAQSLVTGYLIYGPTLALAV